MASSGFHFFSFLAFLAFSHFRISFYLFSIFFKLCVPLSPLTDLEMISCRLYFPFLSHDQFFLTPSFLLFLFLGKENQWGCFFLPFVYLVSRQPNSLSIVCVFLLKFISFYLIYLLKIHHPIFLSMIIIYLFSGKGMQTGSQGQEIKGEVSSGSPFRGQFIIYDIGINFILCFLFFPFSF